MRNRRELVSVLLGVFGLALVLNHVDDLFGREIRELLWLYAVAALVDLVVLCAYLYRRRDGRPRGAARPGSTVR